MDGLLQEINQVKHFKNGWFKLVVIVVEVHYNLVFVDINQKKLQIMIFVRLVIQKKLSKLLYLII